MTTKWSYSGDPSTSTRDAVRFRLGDTSPNDPVFSDGEVDYLVSSEGSVSEAVIAGARTALARYARLVDEANESKDEKASKSHSQRVAQFQVLLLQLERGRGKRVSGIFAGGISRAGKEAQELDEDRVAPAFRRELHNNPDILPRGEGEGS